jgi:diguanylate cyclase (GGDEF)-like protein/PAS domain S-box-containing protein
MTGAPRARNKKAAPSAADELRRQAEERLDKLAADASDAASPVPENVATVVHDLRVYQIELEMQNEELRRVQLELQASREKYFELFDLAPVGYLTLNRESIVCDANLTAARLLGVERQRFVGRPFTAFIFAPDQDVYYQHQRMLTQTGKPQTVELRLKRAGATAGHGAGAGRFWARLEDRPQPGADGETLLSWMTFADIDETVAAQEALRESEEQLDCAVEGSGVGLWDWHVQTGEAVFNERWAEIAGYTLAELSPLSIDTWTNLCHPKDLQRSSELLEQHYCGRSPIYECEARMRHKDGQWIWVLARGKVSQRDSDGRPIRMIGTHLDITARKRAEEALAHLNAELADEAATDGLTNLATRRHFSESLENAVSLARRHGSPLALVSLDLDGLKQINDSAGHAAGDETLTSFAALLDSLCRAEDLPGRLGGDEFSLLLPGTDLSGALGLAERVLAAVRSCEALQQRGATVSGGVAQWSPSELPEDLLRRADEALYAAKRGGGDSVMASGDPPQFNAAGRP